MEEINQELANKIEAILFIYGEPLSVPQLQKILQIKKEEIERGIEDLKNRLASNSGLTLLNSNDKFQLATKPDFANLLQQIIQQETREALTPAALETLSLIAYAGPIARSTIDYIRGVNSSFILRNLLIRGLITRQTDPQRTNVYLYQTSFDLLKHLGLESIESLPEYQKYKDIIKNLNF